MREPVRVIGLGQACVDILGRLPSYPPENVKAELVDLRSGCGGPASTALVTLARLGVSTSFLGAVSDDAFGRRIVEHLEREAVDLSCLTVTPGYTSQFAFIAVTGDDANRTIFWHRGSVPHLSPGDVDLSPFPDAGILHLDGLMIEASVEAARQAKAAGMKVVLDAGTMRDGTETLVSLVDVLIASETFAYPLVGAGTPPEIALEALRRLGPPEAIITLGSRGSVGMGEGGITRRPAFPVTAADTTGAGDVYHGAYIYGMLNGWNMPRCMEFASAAAALKCTGSGNRASIPTLDTVLAFMERNRSRSRSRPTAPLPEVEAPSPRRSRRPGDSSLHERGQPQAGGREHDADNQPDEHEYDKGHDSPIDFHHAYLIRGAARTLEIEECIPERRRQERCLQIDGQHHHEPQGIEPQFLGDGDEEGQADHGDADPVHEHPEHEHDTHHHRERTPLAAHAEDHGRDQFVSPESDEHAREAGGAHHDEQCHRGDGACGDH